MNISARCEYAFRAVLDLALQAHEQGEKPITAMRIAERRSIPEKYLVHILLQLKREGIVRSVRGAQGGYLLAQKADSITLLDVVSAVDGPILDPLPVAGPGSEDLEGVWKSVSSGVSGVLSGVTLQSVLDRRRNAGMYFI